LRQKAIQKKLIEEASKIKPQLPTLNRTPDNQMIEEEREDGGDYQLNKVVG
jgi:hypothetical protein